MSNYKDTVRHDRFGNAYVLKTANAVVDKKSGAVLPVYKTYVEITKPGLYAIEISNRNKETRSGNDAKWVKVTKRQANQQRQGW